MRRLRIKSRRPHQLCLATTSFAGGGIPLRIRGPRRKPPLRLSERLARRSTARPSEFATWNVEEFRKRWGLRLPRGDVLRTRYVRLPVWIKAALAPLLSMAPMATRYGPAYQRLRGELRCSAIPDLAEALQLRALRTTIEVAQQRSTFYRHRMAEAFGGAVDHRSFSLADLKQLPLLSREEVMADPESLLVVDARDADLCQTSGSSGRAPLRIYLDQDRSVREMAFLHHIWSRIGYRLGDGRAILRDYVNNVPTVRRKWRYDRALKSCGCRLLTCGKRRCTNIWSCCIDMRFDGCMVCPRQLRRWPIMPGVAAGNRPPRLRASCRGARLCSRISQIHR